MLCGSFHWIYSKVIELQCHKVVSAWAKSVVGKKGIRMNSWHFRPIRISESNTSFGCKVKKGGIVHSDLTSLRIGSEHEKTQRRCRVVQSGADQVWDTQAHPSGGSVADAVEYHSNLSFRAKTLIPSSQKRWWLRALSWVPVCICPQQKRPKVTLSS